MLNKEFGGTVHKRDGREDGQIKIAVQTNCPLFNGLNAQEEALLTHGDSINKVADGFRTIATSEDIIAGISYSTIVWILSYGFLMFQELQMKS